MCLAIPGVIISTTDGEPLRRTARVRFGGIIKDVSLALTPAARPGGYVMVHAGFSIAEVDRAEARRLFDMIGEEDDTGTDGSIG